MSVFLACVFGALYFILNFVIFYIGFFGIHRTEEVFNLNFIGFIVCECVIGFNACCFYLLFLS